MATPQLPHQRQPQKHSEEQKSEESGETSSWLEYLKCSELVASFQKYCGLQLQKGSSPEKIQIQHKWLHFLMLFGTSLGDETFYSIFFTFWFWNVDGAVGRRVVLVWGICMYIGQSLKDIIRWPRPSSPPVIKLERKWELEYGMPSTHAIVGAAVPATIIYFTSSRYEYPVWIGVLIAVTLCTLVCLSRLYLGMHSVLDILAGLSLVATLLPVVIPLVDKLDSFFFTHEMGGGCLLALGIFMCLCYPSSDRWTPARGDTFVIVGSAVGLSLGCWMNFQLGVISNNPPPSNVPFPYAVMWPTQGMIILTVIRQLLGLVVVVVSKILAKKFMQFLRQRINSLQNDSDMGQGSSSSVANMKPGIVTELFTKYFTYAMVGFTVTHIAPALFRSMGIQRPMFHTEI